MRKILSLISIIICLLFLPDLCHATARTASVTGLWSATATWGGTVPVDGDSVTINTAVTVTMDVDQSAFTGLQGVTITGGATPGMLVFTGASGHLKIASGYNIVGTFSTNNGRLLANSDGVWGHTTALSNTYKAVIDLQGTSILDATHLDINLYCTQPSHLYARTYKALYTMSSVSTSTGVFTMGSAPGWSAGTAVMITSSGTIPTGFSADTLYWVLSPSGSTLSLAPVSGGTAIVPTDQGSGTVQLFDGITNTSSGACNVLDDVSSDAPWTTTAGFNSVVLVSAGPDAYNQQRATLSTIASGVITLGANVGAAQRPGARIYLSSRNVTIQSTATSSSQAIVSTATGCVFQCEIRNSSGSGTTFYGYGLNSSNNSTISGTISGCTIGLNSSNNNTISGTISGCNYGLYSSNNSTISGIISGCNYEITFGGFDTAILRSALTKAALTLNGVNTANYAGRVRVGNLARVAGSHIVYDVFGNITKVACDGSGNHPSVDPAGGHDNALEAGSVQTNCSASNKLRILDNQAIWLTAGAYTVTYKINTTYASGITAGNLLLSAQYLTTGTAFTTVTNAPAISLRSSASDWTQTLAVTFTSAVDGWAFFSIDLFQYAANQVYVYPIPTISGLSFAVEWDAGYPVLYPVIGSSGGTRAVY